MNITDEILRNAQAHPQREALVCDEMKATYAQLGRTIQLVAARLYEAGVRRGDCVALSIGNPMVYLMVALGLARVGAAATYLWKSLASDDKEALMRRHRIRGLVQGNTDDWRSANNPDLLYLRVADVLKPVPADEQLSFETASDAERLPWHIALSSGTTGTPKSIPQTHLHGVLRASLKGGMESCRRLMVLTGFATSMFLNNVTRQFYAGGTVILSRSVDAGQMFKLIERDRPDRIVMTTGVASALVSHAARADFRGSAHCQSVRSVTATGSAVPPALRAGIRQCICDNLWMVYGASEVGALAALGPEDAERPANCCGRLHPWVEAQAVDEADRVRPAGKPGLLRFKTPTMIDGYWGDTEATAKAFRDGWFYPGDMGAVGAGGYLFLGGRKDHVINIGGDKFDPYQIEAVIDAHPAVLESAVVPVTTEAGATVLIAVVVPQGPYDAKELLEFCAQRLKRQEVPAAVVSAERLPKNDSGKVMRRQLAAMVKVSTDTPLVGGAGNATVH